MSNEIHTSDFNLETLKTEFEKCVSASGEVLIEHYILGYVELDKFLHLLGTVFGQAHILFLKRSLAQIECYGACLIYNTTGLYHI